MICIIHTVIISRMSQLKQNQIQNECLQFDLFCWAYSFAYFIPFISIYSIKFISWNHKFYLINLMNFIWCELNGMIWDVEIIITVITWLLFISISLCYKVGFTVIILISFISSHPISERILKKFDEMKREEWNGMSSY